MAVLAVFVVSVYELRSGCVRGWKGEKERDTGLITRRRVSPRVAVCVPYHGTAFVYRVQGTRALLVYTILTGYDRNNFSASLYFLKPKLVVIVKEP